MGNLNIQDVSRTKEGEIKMQNLRKFGKKALYWFLLFFISFSITYLVMTKSADLFLRRYGQEGTVYAQGAGRATVDDVHLLARLVSGEARGEPYTGQVAVAAVIINRVESPKFPSTVSGVVYQPHAFESVSNGEIWRQPPSDENIKAARAALNGWDPTYGCLFFWNPSKPVSKWIWTRQIIRRIGNHVFGK